MVMKIRSDRGKILDPNRVAHVAVPHDSEGKFSIEHAVLERKPIIVMGRNGGFPIHDLRADHRTRPFQTPAFYQPAIAEYQPWPFDRARVGGKRRHGIVASMLRALAPKLGKRKRR